MTVVFGLDRGRAENSCPEPTPTCNPYPLSTGRVCGYATTGLATGAGSSTGCCDKYSAYIEKNLSYPRYRKKCIIYSLYASFCSVAFALPFLSVEERAAVSSISETTCCRHQSPKHISARIELARRRLQRWLIKILPWLNDRSTSTAVAK